MTNISASALFNTAIVIVIAVFRVILTFLNFLYSKSNKRNPSEKEYREEKRHRDPMSLTPNAISTIFRMSGSAENHSFSPTVQIINLKKIDNKSGNDNRWKVSVCMCVLS